MSLCPPKACNGSDIRRPNVGSKSQTRHGHMHVVPGAGRARLDVTQVVSLTVPTSRVSTATCPSLAFMLLTRFASRSSLGWTKVQRSLRPRTRSRHQHDACEEADELFPLSAYPFRCSGPAALSWGSLPRLY